MLLKMVSMAGWEVVDSCEVGWEFIKMESDEAATELKMKMEDDEAATRYEMKMEKDTAATAHEQTYIS